jgi:hypothetical protein
MGLDVRIFDSEDAPTGKVLTDGQERFYTTVVNHARKSPNRFRLFSRIDPAGSQSFEEADRLDLKAEWLTLESVAIGGAERAKWNQVFAALNRKTFVGIQFSGN